jgi:hypothetical protein
MNQDQFDKIAQDMASGMAKAWNDADKGDGGCADTFANAISAAIAHWLLNNVGNDVRRHRRYVERITTGIPLAVADIKKRDDALWVAHLAKGGTPKEWRQGKLR